MKASRLDAYNLMHEGAIALAQVEHEGVRIDTEYLESARLEIEQKKQMYVEELRKDPIYQLIRKRFGSKANINSGPQLAKVLAADLGKAIPKTEKGAAKLDESVLEAVNLPYCKTLLKYRKLDKLSGTYISSIQREIVDGFLHAVFNLHMVSTYRSSCDSPNLQNVPVRNDEIARYIRRAFIPRHKDHVLLEIDYAALEFRIAACYWKDPAMVEYASDPTKDIHRDCAAAIFKTKASEVTKNTRYCGKNMFVFPELYGDFYISTARSCWEAMDHLKLMVGEVPMQEHLRSQGIMKLGLCDPKERPLPNTFEWHVKNVEKQFYEWFPVLKESRDRLWATYQQTGEYDFMTGFVIKGVFKRNFVLNSIIQGPAFHLLLWDLIQLVKWTRKNRTRSRVVWQIHDSMILDVHKDELDLVIEVAKDIMTKKVKEHFDWVITPLDVEVEVGEKNWYEKKKLTA